MAENNLIFQRVFDLLRGNPRVDMKVLLQEAYDDAGGNDILLGKTLQELHLRIFKNISQQELTNAMESLGNAKSGVSEENSIDKLDGITIDKTDDLPVSIDLARVLKTLDAIHSATLASKNGSKPAVTESKTTPAIYHGETYVPPEGFFYDENFIPFSHEEKSRIYDKTNNVNDVRDASPQYISTPNAIDRTYEGFEFDRYATIKDGFAILIPAKDLKVTERRIYRVSRMFHHFGGYTTGSKEGFCISWPNSSSGKTQAEDAYERFYGQSYWEDGFRIPFEMEMSAPGHKREDFFIVGQDALAFEVRDKFMEGPSGELRA